MTMIFYYYSVYMSVVNTDISLADNALCFVLVLRHVNTKRNYYWRPTTDCAPSRCPVLTTRLLYSAGSVKLRFLFVYLL